MACCVITLRKGPDQDAAGIGRAARGTLSASGRSRMEIDRHKGDKAVALSLHWGG